MNRLLHRGSAALLTALLIAGGVLAQDAAADLTTENIELVARQDIYGQNTLAARGQLHNSGQSAYSGISLMAEVYDADDTLIGEGFGYLVNACGAGLLPDYVLAPGASGTFEVPLELYEPGASIDRVEIVPLAGPSDLPPEAAPLPDGITQVSTSEVVEVEWLDTRALRFGVGCARSLFTALDWFQHSERTGLTQPVRHPRADDITDALLTRLELDDPAVYANSALTFTPDGERIVFQGALNIFLTAEPDGTFVRTLYDNLYNRTLQGITWLPEGHFLAYYYGATGDPVIYFTATAQGQRISADPTFLPPSEIVPGVSPDGRRAVIAGTFDEQTGYFLKRLGDRSAPELLFEAAPAGNNWPAPLFVGEGEDERLILALPDETGAPQLQCLDPASGDLIDLAPLPLQLEAEKRARWWLAPDGATIALAADGVNGGLWLIDLTTFPTC